MDPRKANDEALEWLIAIARVWSVTVGLVTAVLLFLFVMDPHAGWRFLVAAVLTGVMTAGSGWWGWWQMGNDEWRRRESQPPQH